MCCFSVYTKAIQLTRVLLSVASTVYCCSTSVRSWILFTTECIPLSASANWQQRFLAIPHFVFIFYLHSYDKFIPCLLRMWYRAPFHLSFVGNLKASRGGTVNVLTGCFGMNFFTSREHRDGFVFTVIEKI